MHNNVAVGIKIPNNLANELDPKKKKKKKEKYATHILLPNQVILNKNITISDIISYNLHVFNAEDPAHYVQGMKINTKEVLLKKEEEEEEERERENKK